MDGMNRYAIYWAPKPGALADFTARWLGWDPVRGCEVAHPDVAGLPRSVAELTATPRKYGFHGTIKAPFLLADGATGSDLHAATAALCRNLAPVALDGLRLSSVDGFLTLLIEGDDAGLNALAARAVKELDPFRATADDAEIARRKPDAMTTGQRAMLDRWGYPYVMDEFRFHLTLTGHFPHSEIDDAREALAPHLTPLLPRPFQVNDLCLFGEAEDRRFRILHRYALGV